MTVKPPYVLLLSLRNTWLSLKNFLAFDSSILHSFSAMLGFIRKHENPWLVLLTSKYFASFLLFAIHGVALSPLEKADSILDFSENFFSDGVGTLDQNVTSPSTMDNAAIFFISDFKRPIFKMVLVLIMVVVLGLAYFNIVLKFMVVKQRKWTYPFTKFTLICIYLASRFSVAKNIWCGKFMSFLLSHEKTPHVATL